MSTQGNWTDFGRIRDGERLEHTPWDTAQDLGSKKCLDVLCSEEKRDEGRQPRQTGDDRFAVPESFGRPAVDEQANDFADNSTVTEARLPLVE